MPLNLQIEPLDARLAGPATALASPDLSLTDPTAADPDALPADRQAPVTRPGDLWRLGRHRLLCGDATRQEAVWRLLGPGIDSGLPALMVTDPPYGISLDSEWRDRRHINSRNGAAAESYMKQRIEGHGETTISNDTIADWSHAFELVPSLKVAYVWHASLYTAQVLEGLLRIGFLHPLQIIWNKPWPVFTRTHYWYQHEPCWYVRKKNAPWYGHPGENPTVWECTSPKYVAGRREEDKFDHPTQKPVELMRRPIVNHTTPADAVYDPFLGSGTTLMAAEIAGRACYGLELEPKYCDLIVRRWQQFTQRSALHQDGHTFSHIAERRSPPCRTKLT